jgi:16S rRNA (uracil1498-N3)-methyltransferase
LDSDFLSNVELYFVPRTKTTDPRSDSEEIITLSGEEFNHVVRVMRHDTGDELFVTDGEGNIFRCRINSISKLSLELTKEETMRYTNKYANITFCLPKLKSPDRFEFALEKCVELGITNFIVYDADKSIAKGDKTDRWSKILISAMKQSLRSYLPAISAVKNLEKISLLEGEKIIFDQEAELKFTDFNTDLQKKYFFIFGPEGGFSSRELLTLKSAMKFSLTPNRLRAETAVISAASILAMK